MPIVTPGTNDSNLTGGLVLIPGYGATIRGHIVVSSHVGPITGTLTPRGLLAALHWYYGPFRATSIRGVFRAIFRASKYISINRKHT